MADATNDTIADAFNRIADLLDILGEDSFRVNAYRKAARTIGDCADDVAELARRGEAGTLPGVGKSSAEKITQFVKEGKIDLLEELAAQVPQGLPALLGIPGMGPKSVAKLWKQIGVTDLASLAGAIEEGKLLQVEGFGPKKVQQLAESMKFVASSGQRGRLGDAVELAGQLTAAVERIPGASKVTPAGSLRRGRETVGDIDILCQGTEKLAEGIIQAFVTSKDLPIRKVLGAGGTKASLLVGENVQADLRVVPAKSFGAALQYFTGSKEHNIRLREIAVKKGLKLNEYGLFEGDRQVAGKDEEDIYEALGLAYVPPELRENRGEVEAAQEGRLPKLLELADIRGDLHMHTTASDGVETIDAMIAACRRLGYAYMAITEHSKSQVQAHGLDAQRLAEHHQAVRAAAEKVEGIRVYFSCEVDIFKDGSLDFPDEVLAELDFVIGSPHSALSLHRAEATERIIKAIEHPYVRVIGHPSGRLINSRPGMELGIEEIAHAAAEHGVALEVNAHPWRLDLRDVHVRAAIECGAKVMIDTDSHRTSDLGYMKYGVITARRGWAKASDVVNALPAAKFERWVRGAKGN